MDPVVEALLPEFRRVRFAQLRITSPAQEAFEFANRQGVDLRNPILDTLSLIVDKDVTSVPVLCEIDFPSLASLTILRGAYMLVKSFVRPTITSLDILFSPPCRASTLAELLAELPLLQYLTLSGIGEEIPQDPLETALLNTMVPLRHLQHLSLEADLQSYEILHLLESLDFPAETEVVFAMVPSRYVAQETVAQYAIVLPRLTSKLLVSNEPSTEAAKMVSPRVIEVRATNPDYRESLNVVLWSSLRPEDLGDMSVLNFAPVRRLKLTFETLEENAIIHFINLVDLSEVVVMDIEEHYSARVWAGMAACFPRPCSAQVARPNPPRILRRA